MVALPRFTVSLDLTDIARHLLIGECSKMPGAPVGVPSVPGSRIVASLREGGDVDIDTSDISRDLRDGAAVILGNVANQVGQFARDPAGVLYRAWGEFAWSGKPEPKPVRALTEAGESALAHGERPL